jgi:hypothetical protein
MLSLTMDEGSNPSVASNSKNYSIMPTIYSLKKKGTATLQELEAVGFKRNFDLGYDEHGFPKSVIIDHTNHQWDFIPEEEVYEHIGKADTYYLIQT